MRNMGKILLASVLSIVLLSALMLNTVSAEEFRLENVLILKDDGTVVRVDYDDYKLALRYKNDLYDYLVNSEGFLDVYGITSGDKYIYYDEYKMKLRYDAAGVVGDAIRLSDPIPSSEVKTFYKLITNEDGTFDIELIFDEDVEVPSATGTFRPVGPLKYGFVVTEVENVEGAARFSVGYHLKEENGPVAKVTDIVDLGEEAGMIFYDPNGGAPYNTVTINIYDANNVLLETFENVTLNVIATASLSANTFFATK